MSVGAELRDPWGWLIAAVSGGLGWAVIGGPAAIVAGVGIGAAVMGTKVAIGALANKDDDRDPPRPRDRLPDAPRASPQYAMVIRAREAVERMRDLSGRPSDTWLAGEATGVVTQSETVLDSLADLSGRVTVLDNSISAAHPRDLADEMARLSAQIAHTTDADLRADQQRALAALDSQSESIARLLRRRDSLLAQMQAAAVGLEGLSTRTGELVALGTASYTNDEAIRIVTDMTTSLDTMRSGIDEARKVLREL